MIHLLALMLSSVAPVQAEPQQGGDEQNDAAPLAENYNPRKDECPGIDSEVLAHILEFARAEFAGGRTYGSVVRNIGLWAEAQQPPVQFSPAQRNCWLKHVRAILEKNSTGQTEKGQKTKVLFVTSIDNEDHADIIAENISYGDITVRLVVKMTNMRTSQLLPLTTTVPRHSKKRLVRLHAQDTRKAWRYHYDYKSAYGSLGTKHDDTYRYRLPYEQGRSFKVLQTFGGTFSHHGESHYAVDFAMPEGSRVYAAREGLVVAIQSSSSTGGPDKSFRTDGNFVYIRHADKSLGIYVHFRKDGVLVKAGDSVSRGQLIGLSGNTGWSSVPHLHFGVKKLLGGDMGQSVPILLESRRGTVKVPAVGEVYLVK